jgi:hypothetical protein
MNPEPRLDSLCSKAERRLLRLRSLVEAFTPPLESEADRMVAFVTLETLNLWDLIRSFLLFVVRVWHPARVRCGG